MKVLFMVLCACEYLDGQQIFWLKFYLWLIQILKKINQLIRDIKREPFDGIGKPEPLKYELSGFCSRRISDEHRLVYEVSQNCIAIVSCRFHY